MPKIGFKPELLEALANKQEHDSLMFEHLLLEDMSRVEEAEHWIRAFDTLLWVEQPKEGSRRELDLNNMRVFWEGNLRRAKIDCARHKEEEA